MTEKHNFLRLMLKVLHNFKTSRPIRNQPNVIRFYKILAGGRTWGYAADDSFFEFR